jgi:hypothetical protein
MYESHRDIAGCLYQDSQKKEQVKCSLSSESPANGPRLSTTLHPTERCGELTRPANAMLMSEANNMPPIYVDRNIKKQATSVTKNGIQVTEQNVRRCA